MRLLVLVGRIVCGRPVRHLHPLTDANALFTIIPLSLGNTTPARPLSEVLAAAGVSPSVLTPTTPLTAILAIGSNAGPAQLARKFLLELFPEGVIVPVSGSDGSFASAAQTKVFEVSLSLGWLVGWLTGVDMTVGGLSCLSLCRCWLLQLSLSVFTTALLCL